MKKLSLLGLMSGILRRVEEVKTKVSELVKKYVNKEKIIALGKKMSTASMAVKIATFSVVMATVPAGTIQVSAKNDTAVKTYDTALKLDTSKYSILTKDENKPVIQVGESEYSKKEREARESSEANREVIVRESTDSRTSADTDSSNETNISTSTSNNISYDPDLATKRALVMKAASRYGIDWRILEAVWQVESGKAWITPVMSYAGAQGPMQFMPGTWTAYAVDGNGDGIADINNAEDAVYAGANLLAQAGAASGDVDSALFSYNHAQWYVDMVKGIANSI